MAVHRQLRSSELYRSLSAEQRSVFFTILLLANWKDQKALLSGVWVTIARGELAHSLATIAEEAAVSVKVVRTTVAKLLADDSPAGGRGPFLVERWTGTRPGTGMRLLSVLRYDEYQNVASRTGTPQGKEGARQGHASGTAGAPREPGEPVEPGEQPTCEPSARPVARKPPKATDPRHATIVETLFKVFSEIAPGERLNFTPGDGKELRLFLSRQPAVTTEEVEARWRLALTLGGKYPGCRSARQLFNGRWDELGARLGTAQLGSSMAPVGQDWSGKPW